MKIIRIWYCRPIFPTPAFRQVCPSAAPSLADFLDAQDLRYSADGFFGLMTAFPAIGKSIYHAGSVEVRRRFSRGLFMLANYTWSRTIDDSTNELFSSLVNPRRPQDPFNIKNERGLSALDMPHKFSLSWTYQLPRVFPEKHAGRKNPGWMADQRQLPGSERTTHHGAFRSGCQWRF